MTNHDLGNEEKNSAIPTIEKGPKRCQCVDAAPSVMVEGLPWRVNTPGLLSEILLNPGCHILRVPLNIFGKLLAQVGERAAELNDPKLNALMMSLAIYSVADPNSQDYDAALVNATLAAANAPAR